MSTDYQVTVTMSQATINALTKSHYYLYGFQAIQSSDAAARPLVWYQSPNYMQNTVVVWQEQYQAYTSTSAIITGGQVRAGFSAPIALGQLLRVQQPDGSGVVSDTGFAGAIAILNATNRPFTCGISEVTPSCALPLYGGAVQVIAPLPMLLLLFATVPAVPGTVIEQSYGPGILIDLNSANQRTVAFDINNGWNWGGYAWARAVPACTNIVPLLVEPSPVLAAAAARMAASETISSPALPAQSAA